MHVTRTGRPHCMSPQPTMLYSALRSSYPCSAASTCQTAAGAPRCITPPSMATWRYCRDIFARSTCLVHQWIRTWNGASASCSQCNCRWGCVGQCVPSYILIPTLTNPWKQGQKAALLVQIQSGSSWKFVRLPSIWLWYVACDHIVTPGVVS